MNYMKALDFSKNEEYRIIQSKIFKDELTECISYIEGTLCNRQAAKRLLDRVETETEKLSYTARAYYLLRQIKRWQFRK